MNGTKAANNNGFIYDPRGFSNAMALYIHNNDANQMYGALAATKNLSGFFLISSLVVAMRPFVAVAAAPDLATHGFFIAFAHLSLLITLRNVRLYSVGLVYPVLRFTLCFALGVLYFYAVLRTRPYSRESPGQSAMFQEARAFRDTAE